VNSLEEWINEKRKADNCEEGRDGWVDAVKAGAVYYQFAMLRPVADEDYGAKGDCECPKGET
jgi:hypothetical protein